MGKKKPNYVIVHPSLYLRTDGKLVEQPVGKQLTLTKKQGEKLAERGFVKNIADVEHEDKSDDEVAALKAEKADVDQELADLKAEKADVDQELADLKAEKADVDNEIVTLNDTVVKLDKELTSLKAKSKK